MVHKKCYISDTLLYIFYIIVMLCFTNKKNNLKFKRKEVLNKRYYTIKNIRILHSEDHFQTVEVRENDFC